MLELHIDGNRARIDPPLPANLLVASTRMEGQKRFLQGGGFSFEPTHHNLKLIREAFPNIAVVDNRATDALWSDAAASPVVQAPRDGSAGYSPTAAQPYVSRTTPLGAFQTEATEHSLKNDCAALLMEQGTGKSKVAIDVAGTRWCNGQITGVLVIAPAGVHIQWVEEAIPEHLGEMVPRRTYAWDKNRVHDDVLKTDKLAFFTINFEAVDRKDGKIAIDQFIKAHRGRVMAIVDESQRIKNPDAKSTNQIYGIGMYCLYRMILSGTPYARDLTDMWSQMKFLDASALGYKYKTAFRAEYCKMNPKIQGVVVGSKNEEKFYRLVAPYTYRVTKDQALDLPPKMYDRKVFELHPEQRKLYDKLKNDCIAELDSGKTVTVRHAMHLVMRLQQITCGFISLDKENPEDPTRWEDLPWNPRLKTLQQLREARLDKVVVWCRFTRDVENCLRAFGESAVSYFGGTGRDERIENKSAFINDPDITEFVSNPSAGGTGVDGLQKVARTAIYYSNSFNSIHRWQSEDRTHRYGMTGTCTYFDLVARNTVDLPILNNLRKKKQLSDLMLDDFRQMLSA